LDAPGQLSGSAEAVGGSVAPATEGPMLLERPWELVRPLVRCSQPATQANRVSVTVLAPGVSENLTPRAVAITAQSMARERLPGLAPGAEPRVLDRDVTTIREVVGGAGENVHGEAGWLQEPPNVE